MSIQIHKKCAYFYYLFKFSLAWTMFSKIHGKLMYITSGSDSFCGQGRYTIKWHFPHLPTGRTYQNYGVFTNLSLNIITSVL